VQHPSDFRRKDAKSGTTDILSVPSNSIPPHPTTEPLSQHVLDSRQSPPPLQTRRGSASIPGASIYRGSTRVGGSSDGQDEQRRIVLPSETG
jgi:hypothetical protein